MERLQGQWIDYGKDTAADTNHDWNRSTDDEIPLSSLSKQDDQWAKQVKWALNHPERIKARCELKDYEKPKLNTGVNKQRQKEFVEKCRTLAPDVPEAI